MKCKEKKELAWIIIVAFGIATVLCGMFFGDNAEGAQPYDMVEPAGFDVVVENNSDETVIFYLYWIDHMYRDANPAPIQSYVAELKARATASTIYKKVGKQYYIIFKFLSKKESINQRVFILDLCKKLTILFNGEYINVEQQK